MTFRQIVSSSCVRNGGRPAGYDRGATPVLDRFWPGWFRQGSLIVMLGLLSAGCSMFRGGAPAPADPPAEGIDALLGGLLPPLPEAGPTQPAAPAAASATVDGGGATLPAAESIAADPAVPAAADPAAAPAAEPAADPAAGTPAPDADPVAALSDAIPVIGPDGEPQLRVGLTLRISVMVGDKAEVPEVTRQITGKGEIDLPFVGRVPCAGLTLPQLKVQLFKLYGDFLRDPEVTAEFATGTDGESPWGKVRVMGHVGSEGWINIPPTRDLTVLRALQLSGGVRPGARRSSVRVTRNLADGSKKVFMVNLDAMGKKGDTEQDIPLQPGDVVWVDQSRW